ncbi:MAG TPA: DUF4266 domain-containing protein [Polyangiaceae bacterium]|jgi:hypothetical protein|nr:DUF4266 domain-containing protein [Polyangiaceae bacterium]
MSLVRVGLRGALCIGALLSLCAVASGCTTVAAYERGRLAHPTMSPSDASSVAREHVYAIQEGAMGGTLGVASGCGCN